MRILKEERILRLLKKDESAGMDLLIETYGGLVNYIVRQKIASICNEQDIEECVADVFVDFYVQLDMIDLKKGSLQGYISLIARRRAIDRFNAVVKKNNHETELDEVSYHSIPDSAPGPETVIGMDETKSFLLKEVEELGDVDGEILFRRYYLEQSLNEIADATGMKRPTVSKRISRALEKLRIKMEGYIHE